MKSQNLPTLDYWPIIDGWLYRTYGRSKAVDYSFDDCYGEATLQVRTGQATHSAVLIRPVWKRHPDYRNQIARAIQVSICTGYDDYDEAKWRPAFRLDMTQIGSDWREILKAKLDEVIAKRLKAIKAHERTEEEQEDYLERPGRLAEELQELLQRVLPIRHVKVTPEWGDKGLNPTDRAVVEIELAMTPADQILVAVRALVEAVDSGDKERAL